MALGDFGCQNRSGTFELDNNCGATAVRVTAVPPGQATLSISSGFDIDGGVTAVRVTAVKTHHIRLSSTMTAV